MINKIIRSKTMTRRHFNPIAQAIKETTLAKDTTLINKRELVAELQHIFAGFNSNFDRLRFYDACEVLSDELTNKEAI
tara:strand:+ start:51 stop:284 length:234 start_codon:yes stop_codon:yes gene_type:complete